MDFARLAELLEELYAPPDPAAGEGDLQIMTIHKAKGLEFGTVIVPGLERAPGRGDAPLMRWKELTTKCVIPAGGDPACCSRPSRKPAATKSRPTNT